MSWQGTLNEVAPGIHEIPSTYRGRDGNLAMRVPGRIVADEGLLPHIADDLAPEQVANVATLPGIVGASLAMPDVHWGYGFPIGGVAAFDPAEGGVVSPGGVGFDINCGVRLLATDLQVDEVRPRLAELADALFARVPCGMGKRGGTGTTEEELDEVMVQGASWAVQEGYAKPADVARMEEGGCLEGAQPEAVSQRARTRGRRTLGSLGSGNHFLEVQQVDSTWDEAAAKAFGVHDGQVVIMIHTGSRGLGHQVCQDHVGALQGASKRYNIDLVDRQLACAPLDSEEANLYLGAMNAAANFAFVNRSIATAHTRSVLADLFGGSPDEGPGVRVVWDVCHNIAKWEHHRSPTQDPDDASVRRLLVHRKGATRAFGPGHAALPHDLATIGQPVVVPGDMGRQSFLLAADAGAMDQTFGSCCHGAGRRLSRTAAKKQWDGADLIAELASRGILVRAASDNVAAEEAPEAYKDVSQVVHAVETAGLAHRVARLRPLCVVKG